MLGQMQFFPGAVPPALARSRATIDKETPGFFARLRKLGRRATRAIARVAHRQRVVGHFEARHETAVGEVAGTRQRLEGHRAAGPVEDDGRRGMPIWLYLLIAAVVVVFWWNLDSGALLVAELPLSTTRILAACIVAVQIGLSHVAGVVARRHHEEIDGRHALGPERTLGIAALFVGVGLGLTVAAVRMHATGDYLVGILFMVLEVALFIVMCWAASRAHQPYKTAHVWAKVKAWWSERSVEWAHARLGHAQARAQQRVWAFRHTVEHILGRVQTLIHAGNARYEASHPGEMIPEFPTPAWVHTLEDWTSQDWSAHGGSLPDPLSLPQH